MEDVWWRFVDKFDKIMEWRNTYVVCLKGSRGDFLYALIELKMIVRK